MRFSSPSLKSIVYYTIYILVGVFTLFKGAIYYPDSYAFLRMDFNRSPLYSSFLKLFTTVFGDNFEYPVIVTQFVLIALSIHFFVKTFQRLFNVSFASQIVLQLILLAPCYHWHFIANKLLSESVSYILFLIIMALFMKAVIQKNINRLFKIVLPLFLLLLTRGQFIVLIPIIFLGIIYINYKEKQVKNSLAVIGLFVLLPLVVSLSEKTYNKIVHDQFINYQLTNVIAISAPFYVADAEDETIFKTQEQQQFFKRTYSGLLQAGFTSGQVLEREFGNQETFRKKYSKICNANVHQLNLDYFADQGLDYYQQQIKVNTLTSQMLIPLIKDNFKQWTALIYNNLKYTFGTAKYMILLLVILGFCLFIAFKTDDRKFVFMSIALLCMFANNTLIATIAHPINRYTFYFDWVLLAVVILLMDPYYKKLVNAS